jgi:hypothetical protein
MIDNGCALEGPAMRSSEAATGTRSRMPACSISTTTGPTTATTTSASADPSTQCLDDGLAPSGGSFLVEHVREATPKARHEDAQPGTAAAPTGEAAEHGRKMKTCRDCKKSMPSESFPKDSKSKDGLHTYCLACNQERRRVYRKTNPEKEREYKKANREKRNAQNRAWRKGRPASAAHLERNRRWRAKNQDYADAYYASNKTKLITKAKIRYRKNKIAILERSREQASSLSDCYVRRRLAERTKLRSDNIPESLVALKRLHIFMLRELKKGKS